MNFTKIIIIINFFHSLFSFIFLDVYCETCGIILLLYQNETDDNVERVLVNGVAEIKCDVSSNIDNDQVLLVVWYKNNLPIYR